MSTEFLRQPIEKIREVQNQLVAEQIELCGRGHKFYKQRWDQHGIDPARPSATSTISRNYR